MTEDRIIKVLTKTVVNEDRLEKVWVEKESSTLSREDRGATLYVPGPKGELMDKLVQAVEHSLEVICVSSFILQKTPFTEALLTAAENATKVYLLTASETHLRKEYSEATEKDKRIIDEHKQLLDAFSEKILVRTGEHLHSKFVLIDPLDAETGFLLTSNLTEKALGENLEVSVELSPEEIRALFVQFCRGFWVEAKQELFKQELRPTGAPVFTNYPEQDAIYWTIGDEQLLKKAVLEMIINARKSIKMTTWSLDPDHEVTVALMEKSNAGIDIEIISRPTSQNQEILLPIVKNGGKVFGHPLMHAKTIITDDEKALVMTSNITPKGLDHGFETGIPLDRDQIAALIELFDEWKNVAKYQLLDNIAIANLESRAWTIKGTDWDEIKTADVHQVDLGEIAVSDEDELDKEPEDLPWPKIDVGIIKNTEFTWTNVFEKSQEEDRQESPQDGEDDNSLEVPEKESAEQGQESSTEGNTEITGNNQ